MTDRILRLFATAKDDLHRPYARLLVGFSAILLLTGCSSLNQHLRDNKLRGVLARCRHGCFQPNIVDARDAAFWASQHERAGSERSVDLYFLATTLSQGEAAWGTDASISENRVIYHESLAGLIRTAQQFGRYDPLQGIRVRADAALVTIPISYHGFTWEPRDFSRLVIADRYVQTRLRTHCYCDGVGVPLTVIRETETPERFHASQSHFAATAILKTNSEAAAYGEPAWTLELANPLTVNCAELNGRSVRIAADYSAPTRFVMGRVKRTYLQDFLRPGVTTGEAKLMLLEPYQPGKIPVIFIHGLLSDPMTWAELYETIHVDRELYDRYQFWAFQYPTGAAFLRSASILRRELATVVACADPDGTDPALSQMVLVGHSMGGLLAKLQVTSSEDRLWQSFANRSMETLQLTSQMRAQLQELFFFEASPHIRRVVFIGTPHNGSTMANRMIGRVGSYLVRIPDEEKRQYAAFLAANPGVVHPFAAKRIPTSVDMLEPDNPVLTAMARMPMSSCVTTHSIIGTGGRSLCRQPSDGVVPVTSAQIPGAESELFVDEDHEDLHRDPESIREVLRILRRHLRCVDEESRILDGAVLAE